MLCGLAAAAPRDPGRVRHRLAAGRDDGRVAGRHAAARQPVRHARRRVERGARHHHQRRTRARRQEGHPYSTGTALSLSIPQKYLINRSPQPTVNYY